MRSYASILFKFFGPVRENNEIIFARLIEIACYHGLITIDSYAKTHTIIIMIIIMIILIIIIIIKIMMMIAIIMMMIMKIMITSLIIVIMIKPHPQKQV